MRFGGNIQVGEVIMKRCISGCGEEVLDPDEDYCQTCLDVRVMDSYFLKDEYDG